MKKIKLGDIFEINTPKGKVHLHYIYKDEVVGDLVRVLSHFYHERPIDIEELDTSIEKFMVFFPLSFAYKKNIGGSLKFGANFPRENNLFVLKCFFYKKADIYL